MNSNFSAVPDNSLGQSNTPNHQRIASKNNKFFSNTDDITTALRRTSSTHEQNRSDWRITKTNCLATIQFSYEYVFWRGYRWICCGKSSFTSIQVRFASKIRTNSFFLNFNLFTACRPLDRFKTMPTIPDLSQVQQNLTYQLHAIQLFQDHKLQKLSR